MLKAISLKVTFWIEGEDEPAHNFVETAQKAINDVLEKGSSSHPELKISIKNIKEHSGSSDDNEAQGDEF